MAGKKQPRCRQCGYTMRKHCQFDEPGVDHADPCDDMHHMFKAPGEAPA